MHACMMSSASTKMKKKTAAKYDTNLDRLRL